MLTAAVTGGIGSGKSTVSAMLADLGAVVVDSDRLARQVVAPGTPGLAAVVEEFGPRVLSADGSLDRAALAAIVFDDDEARHRLEAITHPRVRAAFRATRDAAGPDAIVVNDIPLVRTLADAVQFHLVMTVAAGDELRVRRLIGRGLAESDARARMRAQISDEQRRPLSDVWIENGGEDADLRWRVEELWESRLVPMAANITARRRAARPAVAVVDPVPEWADRARLLAARVSAAAGGARCDHIGSTAVPGLPAKDVIDLQMAVPDLRAADELAEALADAGFPRVVGFDSDHPHPGDAGGQAQDATGWAKRLHANADPDRAVNLHVRVKDAPNWRWALLFRDWLRAEPAERDDYLAAKRAAADEHGGIDGYADAKEPWLAAADARMQRWAERTGWRPN